MTVNGGPQLDARNLFANLANGKAFFIDVRSEKEFHRGHFPNSINIPILCDKHRHLVGITYKASGEQKAIELGHSLVDPHRDRLVARWSEQIKWCHNKDMIPVISCWRGGLRSRIAKQWLSQKGIEVPIAEGGYKAVRHVAIDVLRNLPKHPVTVICGKTGSGKTELLGSLASINNIDLEVIDLEKLAHHRGSAFGAFINQVQPSQASFENALALKFASSEEKSLIFEDESRNIGRCYLPPKVYQSMMKGCTIEVAEAYHNRITRIFIDYIKLPLETGISSEKLHEKLNNDLKKLSSRLGSKLYFELCHMLDIAFKTPNQQEVHNKWIDLLLSNYYDRRYSYAQNKSSKRRVLFRGSQKEVIDFLCAREIR